MIRKNAVVDSLKEHAAVHERLDAQKITAVSKAIAATMKRGGRILICGNGGSAGDAQHFAAELTGRYKKERKGLPAIALTTDTSAITAIGNDYGFEYIFSRQVEALGTKGDILLLISTSGNSPNLLMAANKAKELGICTVALLGKGGGKLKGMCDLAFVVPSDNTPRIQEMHGLIIHIICEMTENEMFG